MNKNKKQIKGNILAEGEVTGHAHTVDVPVFEGPDATREFAGAAVVRHQEHAPIEIPDKKWSSGQVRTFDYLSKMVRPVQD